MKNIFIAGHRGMVGSNIHKLLSKDNIITRTHQELDLTNQNQTLSFFSSNKIDEVYLCAAKVGGILHNSRQKADFIYQNIMIQTNIIHNSYLHGVKKLLFLASSCIYPRLCPQPIKEDYLLSGYLEETNDAYAIAKISGIKMCQSYNEQYNTNFISVMPTNLYGINDSYHDENSHVVPALIKRIHQAKINKLSQVQVWGDGSPKRELLFSADLAEACVFLMENYNSSDIINIGTGEDYTIYQIANIIKDIIYPECSIVFDNNTTLNGTPRKLLDVSKINKLGWCAKTSFEDGIKLAYRDFLNIS